MKRALQLALLVVGALLSMATSRQPPPRTAQAVQVAPEPVAVVEEDPPAPPVVVVTEPAPPPPAPVIVITPAPAPPPPRFAQPPPY